MTQNEFNEKYQNVELVAIKSLARTVAKHPTTNIMTGL